MLPYSRFFALALALHGSLALGQGLPASTAPIKPAPVAPRGNEPEPVPEKLIQFDPNLVSIRRVGDSFQLWAERQLLKDFGPLGKEAEEAVRIIRELGVSRYGFIPGSRPQFEYWLAEGANSNPDLQGPQVRGMTRQIIPFDPRSLRVDQVVGVWCLRDNDKVLYNFGREADAARAALAVCKKYGFNELGVIGAPNPVMTYLVVDPYQGVQSKQTATNPLQLADSVARLGLILPQIGYVGTRTKIELRKLEIVKERSNWLLFHGGEVLGNFGMDESSARAALRALQDYKVTEYSRLGTSGLPLFLVHGQPPRGVPLGLTPRGFQPQLLKAQQLNGTWWVCEGNSPLLDCGANQEEAQLLIQVLKHYGLDQLVHIGHPLREGGLTLLVKNR
jgi:hypothetical protein